MSSINFRKIIISGKICKTGNKITVCADKEVEMKKEAVFMKRLFAAILSLCLLAGCGRTDSTGNTCRAEESSGDGDVPGKTEETGADAGGELFRIIRSQDGAAPLLLAKESGGPGDVYTLSPTTVEPTLDGRSTAAMDLVYTPGTLLEITYGSVLETYPGQLAEVTAVNIRSDGFDDRCALYLRVLNDLWAVDEGLNSDITMLSVDLSQTGLSDSEQAAVAWVFGGMHDISETMTMSYEELAAEGYLSDTAPEVDGIPHWKDGCLFTITEQETGDNELNGARNTVTFDAQKWRSALGAYFFTDCTASRDAQGHWGDYTVGAAAIS